MEPDIRNRQLLEIVLRQLNHIHSLAHYLCKINFNRIFPSTVISPRWSLYSKNSLRVQGPSWNFVIFYVYMEKALFTSDISHCQFLYLLWTLEHKKLL
jgi:hypothetical protein